MSTDFSHYSNRRKSKWMNTNGLRSLYESIIPNEVRVALDDWKNGHREDNYVLIGGLCLSYYLRPRYTEDVDLLFLTEDDLPGTVYKFKRIRPHSFEHIRTGVEVEMVTPELVGQNPDLFKKVYERSVISDGIRIASPVCLIALKLGRFIQRDRDDISALYSYCKDNDISVDLSDYGLPQESLDKFNTLIREEDVSENHMMLDFRLLVSKRQECIKVGDLNVRVFESEYGEPVFYVSNELSNIKRFNDFMVAISLSRTGLQVVESSTGYSDMTGLKDVEKVIGQWYEDNRGHLVSTWNNLNPKRKIS
jgi:hypothetical protein